MCNIYSKKKEVNVYMKKDNHIKKQLLRLRKKSV